MYKAKAHLLQLSMLLLGHPVINLDYCSILLHPHSG